MKRENKEVKILYTQPNPQMHILQRDKYRRGSKVVLAVIAILIVLIGICMWYKAYYTRFFVCQKQKCRKVSLAYTPEQRTQGLMYRSHWGDIQGMLFVFPQEEKHVFWMKNTFLTLDIIRLDKNKRIVDIQSANPCEQSDCPVYTPQYIAQYVIEFPQGTAKNNHWRYGTQFEFSRFIFGS